VVEVRVLFSHSPGFVPYKLCNEEITLSPLSGMEIRRELTRLWKTGRTGFSWSNVWNIPVSIRTLVPV